MTSKLFVYLVAGFLICGFMVAPAAAGIVYYDTTHLVVHCNVDGAHVHAETIDMFGRMTNKADATVVDGIANITIKCIYYWDLWQHADIHLTVTADGYKTVKKDVEGCDGTKHVTINMQPADLVI